MNTHAHMHTHIVCTPVLTSFDFSLLLSHIISVLESHLSQGKDLCLTLTYKKLAVDRSQANIIPLPLTVCLIYSQPWLSLPFSIYWNSKTADVHVMGVPQSLGKKNHVSLPPEISLAFIIFVYVLRQILHKLHLLGESARIYMCLLSLVWAQKRFYKWWLVGKVVDGRSRCW